jgi:hypothetical protein
VTNIKDALSRGARSLDQQGQQHFGVPNVSAALEVQPKASLSLLLLKARG